MPNPTRNIGGRDPHPAAPPSTPEGDETTGAALRQRLAEVEAQLAETKGRLAVYEQMLDQMPINVISCNKDDFKIDYVNKTSLKTLQSIEHLLPIRADEILGGCIDVFHKNPAHQRRILSDPANLPHRAKIKLGDEVLELLVTAIHGPDGDYLGPMVTWAVITEQEKAARETARLMQMLDDMPINVISCNKDDFKIDYVNKTSMKTLQSIEHLLPIRADEILGGCIDVFHKNPAHQRRILSDPANLPHTARIKLGDETLSLKVSAIHGPDGDYLGPMVTWAVITDQVRLADNFETNVKGIVETVGSAATEMQSTAESMTATAEETNRRAGAVAAASEEASTNVQTVASAAEELSSSIDEISRQVSDSTRISQEAVSEAERADGTVAGLAKAATKIGEVVELINDIAGQTNLLALNATIEAARAGDAGRGFAVVASEVKSLANQTAKATEDIGNQIGAIQGATKDAVGAIQGIGKTISQINEIATAIASAVEEQGAATQEIARNVQQAAAGTQDVSSNIAGVTQAAGETGQAAGEVLEAAGELAQQAGTLGTQVDNFLTQVRAM